MTQILRFLKKCLDSRLVTIYVLSLSVLVTPAALGDYVPDPTQKPPSGSTISRGPRYVPPSDQQPPSDYTRSSGPRGECAAIAGIPLTALAPQKHIGQTVSTHPTFAWFVPGSATLPIEFRLYEYEPNGKPRPIGEPISLQSSPGIMKLSLPKDQPELAVGKTYLWQVKIICDSDSPSLNTLARADIQVVEMPPNLQEKLSNTKERSRIVALYAEAGLWYNALGEALGSSENTKLGEIGSILLEELVTLEAAEATPEEHVRVENLRQIANNQR